MRRSANYRCPPRRSFIILQIQARLGDQTQALRMIIEKQDASYCFAFNSWGRSRDDRENSPLRRASSIADRAEIRHLNPLRGVLNHNARRCALAGAAVGLWSFHIPTLLLPVTSQLLRKGKILNSRTRGDLRSLIWEKRGFPPGKVWNPTAEACCPERRSLGSENIAPTKSWVRDLQESNETRGSPASSRTTRGFIVTLSRCLARSRLRQAERP